MGAATIIGAQAQAMQDAAKNSGGAAVGFMGLNMAQGAGGINAQALYQMGQQQQAAAPAPAAEGWTCPQCGKTGNTGKFCAECGTAKPAAEGWTCTKCGTVNKGKFCAECGAPKPAGVPQYKCDKCGWEPEDPANPPKFCPNCGDPFDTGDIV
jgi:membrane protease subunit (stomatin/prohibitin family)